MRRLNMWQRLGIVLSAVWILGGGVAGYLIEVHDADKAMLASLDRCDAYEADRATAEHRGTDYSRCEYAAAVLRPNLQDASLAAAIFALVPIVIAWPLAWAAVKTGKWVLAGRKPASKG